MDRVIEISKSDVPFVFLFLEKDFEMITAFVQFKLPQPLSRDKARDAFSGTAPTYRKIQGLIRKYYVLSEDGTTAAGCICGIREEMRIDCIQMTGSNSFLLRSFEASFPVRSSSLKQSTATSICVMQNR